MKRRSKTDPSPTPAAQPAPAPAPAAAKPPRARKAKPPTDPKAPKARKPGDTVRAADDPSVPPPEKKEPRKRAPKLGPDGEPVAKKPRKVEVPARPVSPRPWQGRRGHIFHACALGVEAFCDVMLDLKPRNEPLTEVSTAYLKGLREWARGNATGHGLEETTRAWLKNSLLVPPVECTVVRALVNLRAIVHDHPGHWEKHTLLVLNQINEAARPTTPMPWRKEPAPDLGPTWRKRCIELLAADAAEAVRQGEEAARIAAEAKAAAEADTAAAAAEPGVSAA